MAIREELAHRLRRATFGPRAEEVDAAERVGWPATLDALLAAPPGPPAPPDLGPDPTLALTRDATREQRQKAQQERREQVRTLTLWWVDQMVTTPHQFREKLTFFWHGHWATSVEKVNSAQLMLAQQRTLWTHGAGPQGALVKAMLRDPALILWLDGHRNTRQAPNENLARELMELFTIGIGTYTEADVKAGARALTGWQVDRRTATATLNANRHDPGSKTILGNTAAHSADTYADLLLAQPAMPKFIAARLWFRYASGEPAEAAVARVAAAGLDTTALVRRMFDDSDFDRTRGNLVKQPVEWAVGAMRQLEIRPRELTTAQQQQLLGQLRSIGQLPFAPPSVGGWPSGAAWLTTSTTQLRLRAAEFLAARTAKPVLDRLAAVPVAQRPDALARLLVVDAWTDRTRSTLAEVAKDPRRLIGLGLATPEYAVS